MAMRSWVLKSWPEVVWQPPATAALWPVFHHMGTDIRSERDELGRTIGETVWAAQLGDGSLLGAAWEWVEAMQGVPALRDPNGFISNAKLVGDDGSELNELELIVGLNRIAHATAWQDVVCQVVGAAGTAGLQTPGALALDWPRALCRIDTSTGPTLLDPSRARAVPANALMVQRAMVA